MSRRRTADAAGQSVLWGTGRLRRRECKPNPVDGWVTTSRVAGCVTGAVLLRTLNVAALEHQRSPISIAAMRVPARCSGSIRHQYGDELQ